MKQGRINIYRILCALSCTLMAAPGLAAENSSPEYSPPEFRGGHAKYQFLLNRFADDSLFNDFVDSPALDHNGEIRLKFDWQADRVSLVTDYQLFAQSGDSIKLAKQLPASILTNPVTSDERRLFDLTHIISQHSSNFLVHRLDRLYVDITREKAVARFGRQAISWGNGLSFTPMDFFNPFDPTAIDTEYKTGDDMLYGQYLQSNGNDIQASWVIRRDEAGDVSNKVDSLAAKYHGFIGNNEYDLLLAEHYEDNIVAAGGIVNIGGAVWRGDVTLTDTPTDHVTSLVTSLSYSWVGWGHNFSGALEYFYNGFGQKDGDYSPAALASNPALVERFLRGELFTLGRHYIAASAVIEMNPLWLFTPNIFINASDHSYLAQLVSTHDLKQDWQLLAALSVPVGESGTEYGGIDSGVSGKPLSTDLSLFVQLAWYF